MKPLVKSSLATAFLAVLGSSVALADDSNVYAQITERQHQIARESSKPTIAVFARERSAGKTERAPERSTQTAWKTVEAGNGTRITYRVPAQ